MSLWDCVFITLILFVAILQWLTEMLDSIIAEKWKDSLLTLLAIIGAGFLIYDLWTKGYHP